MVLAQFLCKACGAGRTYECAAHPHIEPQSTHQIHGVECTVKEVHGLACTGASGGSLIDMACGMSLMCYRNIASRLTRFVAGHPICVSCATNTTKNIQSRLNLLPVHSWIYRCPRCRVEINYNIAMCMPRLEHCEAARVSVFKRPMKEWKRAAQPAR
jgi:hypothetical protein